MATEVLDVLGLKGVLETLAAEDPDTFLDVTEPMFLEDPEFAALVLGEALRDEEFVNTLEPEDILGSEEELGEEDLDSAFEVLDELLLADKELGLELMKEIPELGEFLREEEGATLSEEEVLARRGGRSGASRGGGRSRVIRGSSSRARSIVSRARRVVAARPAVKARVKSAVVKARPAVRRVVAKAATRKPAQRKGVWSKVTGWVKGKGKAAKAKVGKIAAGAKNRIAERRKKQAQGYARSMNKFLKRREIVSRINEATNDAELRRISSEIQEEVKTMPPEDQKVFMKEIDKEVKRRADEIDRGEPPKETGVEKATEKIPEEVRGPVEEGKAPEVEPIPGQPEATVPKEEVPEVPIAIPGAPAVPGLADLMPDMPPYPPLPKAGRIMLEKTGIKLPMPKMPGMPGGGEE